ncbi:MAG: pyrroline-5-carboxylate reductase family protein, partial [Polymorphobacter sp.]
MSAAQTERLWLLGAGNMGGALLARWQVAGLADISVIDPNPQALPAGVVAGAAPPPGAGPDVLVLAVKPQLFAAASAGLGERLRPDTLVISVMAGVTCAGITARLGARPLVRTMPNTPARLGQGVTALFGCGATAAHCARAEALLAAAGATVWLEAEAQFDAVTGLSGSGPAYVFAFIEALAAAGVA